MDEKQIQKFNRARQSQVAFDAFKPFLDKERGDILSKLKMEFRSGKNDLSVYVGLVSTLVSLDDLEGKLLKTIRAGQSTGEKVMTEV